MQIKSPENVLCLAKIIVIHNLQFTMLILQQKDVFRNVPKNPKFYMALTRQTPVRKHALMEHLVIMRQEYV